MNELENSWTITWNENAGDTYLYGSEIRFIAQDDVEFRNALMPAGTVIKVWYSMLTIRPAESSLRFPLSMAKEAIMFP